MEQFPDEHELIQFFEAEPAVLDPDVVWSYNHLEFHTVRGADDFTVVIEPGYMIVKITWKRAGVELVRVDLERVRSLRLEMSQECEAMILEFDDRVGVGDMRLQLKPQPKLSWDVPPCV